MDAFNPETWKQQWAAFMSYPFIMLPLLAIMAAVVWWLRSFQIKVLEERLKLAGGKVELSDRARDEVIRQLNDLKTTVVGNGALAARVAGLEAAVAELSSANNAVRSAVIGVSAVGRVGAVKIQVDEDSQK